jgi:hypothetical protein
VTRAPVVLLLFRRPECTARVFERIRRARPPVLYLVADGPRGADDEEGCERARAAVARVDWPCEVRRDYAAGNLGLRERVVSGLGFVFGECERAVVLEDDCLPDPTFFDYCDAVLERWKDDERVMQVGGFSVQRGGAPTPASYYFSKYALPWGWASWARAWRHYDPSIASWPALRDGGWADAWFDGELERSYWTGVFDAVHAGRIASTWDYAWSYACWAQGGLSAVPWASLIRNVGWGPGATHTHGTVPLAEIDAVPLPLPVVHPTAVSRHRAADLYTFDHYYPGQHMKRAASIRLKLAWHAARARAWAAARLGRSG